MANFVDQRNWFWRKRSCARFSTVGHRRGRTFAHNRHFLYVVHIQYEYYRPDCRPWQFAREGGGSLQLHFCRIKCAWFIAGRNATRSCTALASAAFGITRRFLKGREDQETGIFFEKPDPTSDSE